VYLRVVVGIIKRILGGKGGLSASWDAEAEVTAGVGLELGAEAEGGLDYDGVMANLEYKRMEVEQVKDIVIREIKESYDSIVKSLKEGDRETAELLAAEVALKKNIVKALSLVSKLLKLAIARIKTAKTAEEAVKALGPVVAVLRSVGPYLSNVSPELAVQISAIRDEIERLYMVPGLNVSGIDTKSVLDMAPEAKKILREAAKEASEELSYLLPEEPTEATRSVDSIEELSGKLLEYIKENNGRLSLRRASKELGVPEELVKAALYYLEKKGVIRVRAASKRIPGAVEA
jgi:division protein CdvB (Snf7/Vps24/ESCRT-III family)